MVYLNVRHTVADYEKWRMSFDAHEPTRLAVGATGVKQVFRDADNPNNITVILEWDKAMNAQKFMNDPKLSELMKESGVIGMPAVRTMLVRA
jgi:hypothetical protein